MGYCTWAGMNEANRTYHDTEWGIPVHDDRHMFEHLTLECLQCGLSWDLMLKKREIFLKKLEQETKERGITNLVLHASEMGRKAYMKSGFSERQVVMEKKI